MSDALYVEVRGQGQDIILLHGWAMHGGVWPESLLAELEQFFCLHIVDLPGHGNSIALLDTFTLNNVTDVLHHYALTKLNTAAIWLGWSLGGMLAANMAVRHPECVAKLVLISSSLRFCKADDWPDAMDPTVLELFAAQLRKDYRTTLSRFLALQFKGDAHAREGLRKLREQLFSRGQADNENLNAGLEILLNDDLRWQANKISQPVQLIGGEYDSLTPAAALQQIAVEFKQAQSTIIKGAGHAPFISHTDNFKLQLTAFLYA